MALEHAYQQALPASRALFERAQHLFPDGVTHDNRRMQPFPIFVERADGAYKWDVDGRQYIDYWMGHGALIMGHNPPHVRDAVIEQAARGTHYGANHALEVSWAEWVCKLVPCAERVRFTASGTEATHMALRLARAYTGKRNVIKFAGHFHGWHEGLEVGVQTPYETVPEPGQMQEAVDAVALCPPNDIAAVQAALAAGDVAAIILEPTGGHFGTVPVTPSFLQRLREEATRAGVVLIFDEVVTGFRVAPGGAQELYGVTPDLSTWGKAIGNGFAVSALAGKRDLMEAGGLNTDASRVFLLSTTHGAETTGLAAYLAVSAAYAERDVVAELESLGTKLRSGLEEVSEAAGMSEHVSFLGRPSCLVFATKDHNGQPSQAFRTLFIQELLRRGVLGQSLVISAAHTDADIEQTIEATAGALSVYARAVEAGSTDGLLVGRPVAPAMREFAQPRRLRQAVAMTGGRMS